MASVYWPMILARPPEEIKVVTATRCPLLVHQPSSIRPLHVCKAASLKAASLSIASPAMAYGGRLIACDDPS